MVNTTMFTSFRGVYDNLPEAGRPLEADDSSDRIETRDFALVRHRSMMEGSALACLRAHPFDHAQMMLASEYVPMRRRFWI